MIRILDSGLSEGNILVRKLQGIQDDTLLLSLWSELVHSWFVLLHAQRGYPTISLHHDTRYSDIPAALTLRFRPPKASSSSS